jgi:MazG family protein
VLFQVHFLSLLLEERGAGDLAAVAEHCRAKLVRRHPHVFGDAAAATAGEVLRNWDRIKRDEPGRANGIFGDVPENLPALLHARKVQRRAASTGFDFRGVAAPLEALAAELEELAQAVRAAGPDAEAGAAAPPRVRDALFHEVGDVLFAAVNVARRLRVDPELALRSAGARFRGRVETAERLAAQAGEDWADLPAEHKLSFYAEARLREE